MFCMSLCFSLTWHSVSRNGPRQVFMVAWMRIAAPSPSEKNSPMAAQLKIAFRRFLFSVCVEYILSYLFKFPSNLICSYINPPSRIGVVLDRRADGFVRNDFLCCHFGTSNRTTTTRERADFATGQATVRKFASLCERKSVVVACELLYLDFASEWLVTGMESRLG